MAAWCWHIVQEEAGGILSPEVRESQPEVNLATGFSQTWLLPSVDLLCDLRNRRYLTPGLLPAPGLTTTGSCLLNRDHKQTKADRS